MKRAVIYQMTQTVFANYAKKVGIGTMLAVHALKLAKLHVAKHALVLLLINAANAMIIIIISRLILMILTHRTHANAKILNVLIVLLKEPIVLYAMMEPTDLYGYQLMEFAILNVLYLFAITAKTKLRAIANLFVYQTLSLLKPNSVGIAYRIAT